MNTTTRITLATLSLSLSFVFPLHSLLADTVTFVDASTTESSENVALVETPISSDETIVLLDQVIMLQNEIASLNGKTNPAVCYTWTKDFALENPDTASIEDALKDCMQ